jgi:hypothetical protein
VLDPGGSVVPGVAVKIQHAETGVAREVTSDNAGNYVAVQLPIGTFTVRASAAGFKEWVQADVVLRVNDNRRIDITIQVGQVTERIEVSAAITQVETRTGTIGEVIDSRRIAELPLNGRNPIQRQS